MILTTAQLCEIARTRKLATIYRMAKQKLDFLVGKYSPGEMAVWMELESQARAYIADNNDVGTLLDDEATAASRTLLNHANNIVANADSLRASRISVVGARTIHRDVIEAFDDTDYTVIDAYDTTTGW